MEMRVEQETGSDPACLLPAQSVGRPCSVAQPDLNRQSTVIITLRLSRNQAL